MQAVKKTEEPLRIERFVVGSLEISLCGVMGLEEVGTLT